MRFVFAWLFVFLSQRLVCSQSQCSHLTNCESCAGIEDSGLSCRWCLETSSCVPSKYMCHPWKTVLHVVNCPVPVLPTTYNETFMRNEVIAYVQAANRVSHQSPVGAPMSCLMRLQQNVEVFAEMDVPTTLDSWSEGVLIGINHDRRHIFIGFRSTNNAVQLLVQYYIALMGWMIDFPLGGKMLASYVQEYKDILNFGFDVQMDKAVAMYPSYDIFVTGHSLGGAMASVLSLHVAMRYPSKQVRLYTLSAIRSGDETFVRLLKQHLFEEFRIVRDGDFIPDLPIRVSHTLETPHHNSFEVFYGDNMTPGNYKICDQPETEYCLKGSWWKKPTAHVFLFDENLLNWHLGYCDFTETIKT